MCNSAYFSHSQRGNSPVEFKISPQGKCKVSIRAEGEFLREHSLFHFPLRLKAEKEFLEKSFYKEACNFIYVLN